jgi:large subunit ribosomal protein L13
MGHTGKTFTAKPSDIKQAWRVVDAEGQTLGRLATEVARILMGKHKATYTRTIDTGDFVVVINAGKIKVTGNKLADKAYFRHSGYPGGDKTQTLGDLMAKKPTAAIERAVKGMLPSTKLGRAMFKKLKVYEGAEHPHEAQNPSPLVIGG